jgi:hypothetical protein
MPLPSPPATEARPADTPRARRIRFAGILFLAVATGAVGWLALRSRGASRPPSSVYDYVRDRVRAGDGEALWRVLLPEGRSKYTEFVRAMGAERTDNPAAAAWRKKVGLSAKELLSLPPGQVMAREYEASAGELLEGSRVYRTDLWDENTALLYISLRDGRDKYWLVKRAEGDWKVSDPEPVITNGTHYIPRPGVAPVKMPVPLGDGPVRQK